MKPYTHTTMQQLWRYTKPYELIEDLEFLMFADDIKLYRSICSLEDCLIYCKMTLMYCLTGCYPSVLQNVRFYTVVTLRTQVTIL